MARLAALILIAVIAAAGLTVAGAALRGAGAVSISADGPATPTGPNGSGNTCPSCV